MNPNIGYLLVFSVITLGSCVSEKATLQTTIVTRPRIKVNPERMLILNTCDISSYNYRDGKEALFIQMIDTVLTKVTAEIKSRADIEVLPVFGLNIMPSPAARRDSLIKALMTEYDATDAIVITFFDVFFDGDVNREERGANYDLVSRITYFWYKQRGIFNNKKIETRRFYDSRILLFKWQPAIGPNIVANSADAYQMVEKNYLDYLNLFFPGYEYRQRIMFLGREFLNMRMSVDAQNYLQAFSECSQLTTDKNRKIASRANYNCAVLLERMEQHDQVKKYLAKSVKLKKSKYASLMLMDY